TDDDNGRGRAGTMAGGAWCRRGGPRNRWLLEHLPGPNHDGVGVHGIGRGEVCLVRARKLLGAHAMAANSIGKSTVLCPWPRSSHPGLLIIHRVLTRAVSTVLDGSGFGVDPAGGSARPAVGRGNVYRPSTTGDTRQEVP